ncbi:zinc knuckle CX2CX4HX4C containing protein, partial [Tanacetum coccineum]
NTDSSNNSEGIATIVNKLESLGQDMKKLKENVYAIQVGCQTCRGAHLDKECPLNKEVKNIEEVKYGEFVRPFPNNSRNDGRFNRGASGYDQPSSGERRPSLTEKINKYMEEAAKRHAEQDEWLKKFYENTKTNREAHDKIIQGLETKVRTLKNEVEGRANGGKFEGCKEIWFSDNERQETDKSGMAEALAALEATHEIKKVPQEEKQSLPHKEQDLGGFILPCSIGRLDFNNALADLGASISIMPLSIYKRLGIGKLKPINMVIEMADNTKCTPKGIVENLLIKIDKFVFPVDFVILDIVEDFRMPIILGRPLLATAHAKVDIFRKSISLEVGNEKVIFKMRSSFTTMIFESVRSIRSKTCTEDDDFKKINYDLFLYDSGSCTSKDEDDLEGILDYLKPRSYDGLIDLDNKAYNKRRCRLLGLTYEDPPPPILIKKVKVTRYIICPEEIYIKVKVLGIEEMPRTRDNVASIRARLMEKMANEGNGQAKT